MELLFVTVIAAGIGLIVAESLRRRQSYGVLLLPAVDAMVTAAVWVLLVWLGWKFDATWIWVVSLVAGGVVAIVLAIVLPRMRAHADERLMQRLLAGRA